MDDEIIKYLWTSRRLIEALVKGLKSAVFVLEKVDEISPERRQDTVDSLKKLISESEKIYQHEPTKP
jgi:hypothetical protein